MPLLKCSSVHCFPIMLTGTFCSFPLCLGSFSSCVQHVSLLQKSVLPLPTPKVNYLLKIFNSKINESTSLEVWASYTKTEMESRSSQFSIFTSPGAVEMISNTVQMKLKLDISSIVFTFPTYIGKGDYTSHYRVLQKEWVRGEEEKKKTSRKCFSTDTHSLIYLILLIFKTIKSVLFLSQSSIK